MKPIVIFLILFDFIATAGETNTVLQTKQKLLAEIRKQENKIYDLTNGIPKWYIMNSDETNNMMGKRIEEVWGEYDKAMTNLISKKKQFHALP